MLKGYPFKKVYIACGYTDLRCGIDGLAGYVTSQFHLSPVDENVLFLFCGRRNDRIKGLLWEGDGFLLLYKRAASGSFKWPRKAEELRELSAQELEWLLSGLSIDNRIRKVDIRYAV